MNIHRSSSSTLPQAQSEFPLQDDHCSPNLSPIHETLVLNVSGMKCAGCVRAIERCLITINGVISVTTNLVTEVVVVTIQPSVVTSTQLADAVTLAGFPTTPRHHESGTSSDLSAWVEQKRQEQRQHKGQLIVAVALLGLSTTGHLQHFGWFTVPILSNLWFHALLATLTLLVPARGILSNGWHGLRRLAPNMNTLVGLGSVSAYLTSAVALLWPQLGWECFFDEPVMLLSFILLGRTLEKQARFRAADSLRSLVELQPTIARLIADPAQTDLSQTGVEVPASYVQVGEWIQILPGEKIPADGEVVLGQSTVDEAMLTGEAIPVLKQPGDAVVAGTLNQSGAIALRVTKTGKDTLLSQMIQMVEMAQSRKAPIQRLADQIAGYFTYGVITLSTLTFLFWYWVGLSLWPEVMPGAFGAAHNHSMMMSSSALLISLKLAIAVLVIACPCALGLATPTAILVGSGLGAERGLLIRGGDVLETVHRLDTIVFDKTGTLTVGKPQVTDIQCLSEDLTTLDILQLAATLESGTQHPLAVAVQKAAAAHSLPLLKANSFHTEPGLGVSAQVCRHNHVVRCILGNQSWMEQHHVEIPTAVLTQASAYGESGETPLFIALKHQLVGVLAVADVLRTDAKDVIANLHQQGITVKILTGDRSEVAWAVANRLGLDPEQVIAGVSPQGKLDAIQRFQSQGQIVALVGDGINDAPALAQANVGISLTSGTDIATETADIILMRDQLSGILETITLSRATFNKIRQNLGWALAYNVIGIPLAAGILLPTFGFSLSPAAAGGFMAFSSVAVILNSLSLKR